MPLSRLFILIVDLLFIAGFLPLPLSQWSRDNAAQPGCQRH